MVKQTEIALQGTLFFFDLNAILVKTLPMAASGCGPGA
jgi:hypothetical protein